MHAPRNHKLTQTEDGSFSLFSEAYQEGCHSSSGAREETELHYLKGCQVREKLAAQRSVSILEVGFGTGLGFEMTRDLVEQEGGHLHFLSIEIDADLTIWSFERLGLKFNSEPFLSGSLYSAEDKYFSLRVLVGNARALLPHYLESFSQKFSAIYQDAFSPKRNPVLWTTEWFTLLKTYSGPEVILSTYSASNSIRKSLRKAGWSLRKGEAFGPKRASTRADLLGDSDQDILDQMNRSPAQAIEDVHLPKELFL